MSADNEKRKTVRFSAGDKFKLMKLVDAEFISYGVTDAEFAKYASATLGLEAVNHNHIIEARRQLGIVVKPTPPMVNQKGRLDALEKTVADLSRLTADIQRRLDVYLSTGTVRS